MTTNEQKLQIGLQSIDERNEHIKTVVENIVSMATLGIALVKETDPDEKDSILQTVAGSLRRVIHYAMDADELVEHAQEIAEECKDLIAQIQKKNA